MSVLPMSSNSDVHRSFRIEAKITMLRLNTGSGMLRLSPCVLRLSLTSSVQGGRGGRGLLGLMR